MSYGNAALQTAHEELTALAKKHAALLREAAAMDVPDVTLLSTEGAPVTLSSLFGDRSDLIVIHNMGKSCRGCTLWADGFRGHADHLASRTAFALLTPDDPATAKAFRESRHWNYPVACYGDSGLAHTLGFEPEPGTYWPGFSALHKDRDNRITRVGMGLFGPGDAFCPVWHFFDQLKDGPNGWEPQYDYRENNSCCSSNGCGCSTK